MSTSNNLNSLMTTMLLISSVSTVNTSLATPISYVGSYNAPLHVDGVTYDAAYLVNAIVNTPVSGTFQSAFSVGGNNGTNGTSNDYKNLAVGIDKNSKVTATGFGDMAAVYIRSDSADAQVTAINSGEINTTSAGSSGRTIGILNENLGNAGGKVTITLEKESKIVVSGANNLYGVLASGPNAVVTTKAGSNITLVATSNTTYITGIFSNATANHALVENNGTITIGGTYTGPKAGIKAESNYGSAEVNNSGQIEIEGVNGVGVHAIGGNGIVTVKNKGTVAINGSNGSAITATGNTGSLTTSGNITVDGENARGALLISTDANETADQKITASGNITVTDTSKAIGTSTSTTPSYAISLENNTKGKGIIDYNDTNSNIQMDIGTTGGAASAGILSTSTQGGDTQIDVAINELNINGKNTSGIYSTSTGPITASGNTNVNFTQGKMNIVGDNADGINIVNTNVGGNVTVQQDGDIAQQQVLLHCHLMKQYG